MFELSPRLQVLLHIPDALRVGVSRGVVVCVLRVCQCRRRW